MVYLVADYKEHGVDCHNEFVVGGTEDQEQAVYNGERPAGLFILYPFV